MSKKERKSLGLWNKLIFAYIGSKLQDTTNRPVTPRKDAFAGMDADENRKSAKSSSKKKFSLHMEKTSSERDRTNDPYFKAKDTNVVKRDLNPLPETSIKIKQSKKKTKGSAKSPSGNEIDVIHNNNFTNKTNLFIVNNSNHTGDPDMFLASSMQQQQQLRKSRNSIATVGGDDDDDNEAEIYPGSEPNENEEPEEEPPGNDFSLEYFDVLNQSRSKFNIVDFIQVLSPKETKIRCKLIVNRGIFNEYTLYLENFEDKDLPLMTTKRKKASAKVYYTIVALTEPKNNVKFGFVESNLTRRAYSLVGNLFETDDGANTNESNSESNEILPRYLI